MIRKTIGLQKHSKNRQAQELAIHFVKLPAGFIRSNVWRQKTIQVAVGVIRVPFAQPAAKAGLVSPCRLRTAYPRTPDVQSPCVQAVRVFFSL